MIKPSLASTKASAPSGGAAASGAKGCWTTVGTKSVIDNVDGSSVETLTAWSNSSGGLHH